MDSGKPEKPTIFSSGEIDKEILLEQYRLFVEMMDKAQERRQNTNSFFFSLCAGLFAAVAFLHSKDTDTSLRPLAWVVPVAGVPISFFWYRLIDSYRHLGTAKFGVIHEMETKLACTPYSTEWKLLGEGKEEGKYMPLTHLERWVPRWFCGGFVLMALWTIPWSSMPGSAKMIINRLFLGH